MPSPLEASTSASPSPKSASDHEDGATQEPEETETSAHSATTFEDLGVIPPLLEALKGLKFTQPTEIQAKAIPSALSGKDIIGVAETGSGKTAAFALPILQKLWDNPKPYFACVLAPTRELAYQISNQFEALGSAIGVRCAVIIGGMDIMEQSISLTKRPHIIIATPGRLQDHLEGRTKGFSLRSLQYLVLDEADRLLDLDFGPIIEKLVVSLPMERHTFLFSATMTTKVAKLQHACLRNPMRIEASTKYQTASNLIQHYLFIPFAQKDVHLVYLLTTLAKSPIIVFTRTVHDTQRLSLLVRSLGLSAIPIHGQLDQAARLAALTKFRSGGRNVLFATDVASRGIDIPSVDFVFNYDIPQHSKDYVHRVGRTARAGRAGKSITFVSQYDVELLQRIESVTGKKMTEWVVDKDEVAALRERVGEAQRAVTKQMKEEKEEGKGGGKGGRKRKRESKRDAMDRDDDQHEAGLPNAKKVFRKRKY
ncbi:DEAD-domain-containing protein [Cantharellus anzutake]|uniref:DEAD-domain-containing protein n=1 Tax=Cantharellus anzutake TaxID=1750568 RepID=UPI00190311B1|nr:DEAD-domain-containing protein [Cantharellus anzutake]KAF8337524.1 DEAD-domain-containing protein [Cantharellus anzutake]